MELIKKCLKTHLDSVRMCGSSLRKSFIRCRVRDITPREHSTSTRSLSVHLGRVDALEALMVVILDLKE